MCNAGRHQATGGGRWRALLARHPRSALFGIGVGIAVVAGVVMMALSSQSMRSGPGGCGLVVCGGTLPPAAPATTPHRRQPARTARPGPAPSPVSQIASAATPRVPGRHPGSPARHPTHDHPTHPAHPTPPGPSHPTRQPQPAPTPTTTVTGALRNAARNWTSEFPSGQSELAFGPRRRERQVLLATSPRPYLRAPWWHLNGACKEETAGPAVTSGPPDRAPAGRWLPARRNGRRAGLRLLVEGLFPGRSPCPGAGAFAMG
jgi:hypothetical protein